MKISATVKISYLVFEMIENKDFMIFPILLSYFLLFSIIVFNTKYRSDQLKGVLFTDVVLFPYKEKTAVANSKVGNFFLIIFAF